MEEDTGETERRTSDLTTLKCLKAIVMSFAFLDMTYIFKREVY